MHTMRSNITASTVAAASTPQITRNKELSDIIWHLSIARRCRSHSWPCRRRCSGCNSAGSDSGSHVQHSYLAAGQHSGV